MSPDIGLDLQFYDAEESQGNGPLAKVLLLGGLGPLSPSALPQPDEETAALFAGHDLRGLGLLADAAFAQTAASGKTALDFCAKLGADVVSLAGMEGGALTQTRGLLGAIDSVGAGEAEAEAFRPVVRNIGGIRLGILAFSERRAERFDGRANILHPMVYDRVRMLQAQCDHIVVFCHAGLPKANLPLPDWRARYRRFIDAGASIVAGMPPSGISGWEEYRNGLVFYGLGTLADDREDAGDRSLALQLALERNGRFRYEVRMLERAGGTLRLCEREAEKKEINDINALLVNERAYLEQSSALCRTAYETWERENCANSAGSRRGLLGAFLPQTAEQRKREEEARLRALLENESLRMAVLCALETRQNEKTGDRV